MMFPHRSKERGAAMVEFALIVPILLVIIFAAIDFSYSYQFRSQVNNAAGVAARQAASGQSISPVSLSGALTAPSPPTVSIVGPTCPTTPVPTVAATVRVRVIASINPPTRFWGSQVGVSRTVTMECF